MKCYNIDIAICDDEEAITIALKREVENVTKEMKLLANVECFTSGKDLLTRISEFQLVFLDLDMPEMDGRTVGLQIKKCNPDCRIVIASSREDRFKETYKMEPLCFVSKPFRRLEIEDAISEYMERQVGYTPITVYKERTEYTFNQREIQYVASYRGGVEVVKDFEIYHQYITMEQFEQQLEKKIFFRVHRKYIVNMQYVTEYKEDKVIILNKISVPVARSQRKSFREAYMKFDVTYR